MQVVISNGFNRFQLAPLSVEIARHGSLAGLLTGGWPKGLQRRWAERFSAKPGWKRFLDRAEPLDEKLIHSFWGSEIAWQAARFCRTRWLSAHWVLSRAALNAYARQAARVMSRIRPAIYHYRNCFGLQSVPVAKKVGAIALCDHSIAHPAVLGYLVNNGGRFPPKGARAEQTPLEEWMQEDLQQADHTLVNSNFMKETCVYAGMDPARVHVVYWGVDQRFLAAVPAFDPAQVKQRGHGVLYAGDWQTRKGAQVIERAWRETREPLTIAGSLDTELSREAAMTAFFARPEIRFRSVLSRTALAQCMTEHAIFVFPSLCEGSARVVFEAMACGCYIITTPNAGSIVRDRVHGRVVAPGDADALKNAVSEALASRDEVARIGWQNACLVREQFTQRHYGENVMALYEMLRAKR